MVDHIEQVVIAHHEIERDVDKASLEAAVHDGRDVGAIGRKNDHPVALRGA
jgi:hypothetical protein